MKKVRINSASGSLADPFVVITTAFILIHTNKQACVLLHQYFDVFITRSRKKREATTSLYFYTNH